MKVGMLLCVLIVIPPRAFATSCECWVTNHVDEWENTEHLVLVLVCSDPGTTSAVVLYNNREVMFYDGNARTQTGAFVFWEYRIGDNDTIRRLYFFWNRDRSGQKHLKDESDFPRSFPQSQTTRQFDFVLGGWEVLKKGESIH